MAPLCRRGTAKSPGQGHPPHTPNGPDGQQLTVPGDAGRTWAGKSHVPGTPGPRAQLPGAQPRPTPPCGTGSILYFSAASPWVSPRAPSRAGPHGAQPAAGPLGPLPVAGEAQTAPMVIPRPLPAPPPAGVAARLTQGQVKALARGTDKPAPTNHTLNATRSMAWKGSFP